MSQYITKAGACYQNMRLYPRSIPNGQWQETVVTSIPRFSPLSAISLCSMFNYHIKGIFVINNGWFEGVCDSLVGIVCCSRIAIRLEYRWVHHPADDRGYRPLVEMQVCRNSNTHKNTHALRYPSSQVDSIDGIRKIDVSSLFDKR
jgi:hypothetical protein